MNWTCCFIVWHHLWAPMHIMWRRPIECLKLQVIFRNRATNYMALLSHFTYELDMLLTGAVWKSNTLQHLDYSLYSTPFHRALLRMYRALLRLYWDSWRARLLPYRVLSRAPFHRALCMKGDLKETPRDILLTLHQHFVCIRYHKFVKRYPYMSEKRPIYVSKETYKKPLVAFYWLLPAFLEPQISQIFPKRQIYIWKEHCRKIYRFPTYWFPIAPQVRDLWARQVIPPYMYEERPIIETYVYLTHVKRDLQ